MTEHNFDLIVFDWDGTLLDSTSLIASCIQESCVDLGLPRPADRDASYVIGLGLKDALTHAAPSLPRERYRELALRYRHHYETRQHELVLFDGAFEMLQTLKKRRHRIAVATGKTRLGLDEALASAHMQGLFDATRTSDETAPKPDPKMLVELMDELGAEPGRTLMIGDTTHDLQLAANAGTASVAVSYGAHAADALGGLGPRHIAASVADLEHWLLRHG